MKNNQVTLNGEVTGRVFENHAPEGSGKSWKNLKFRVKTTDEVGNGIIATAYISCIQWSHKQKLAEGDRVTIKGHLTSRLVDVPGQEGKSYNEMTVNVDEVSVGSGESVAAEEGLAYEDSSSESSGSESLTELFTDSKKK